MPVHQATAEFVLNYAMNRWGLNYKRNVGPTSKSIRECDPNTRKEWAEYYFENVYGESHLEKLGKRLYQEIKNTVSQEDRFHPDLIDGITEQQCIEYMHEVVINRTFDGFARETGLST